MARLIDDTITSVVPEVRRVILLGAGFDTRAHRLPALRSVEVVEVDHPATQARKRARLGGRSDRVRYVATDFTDGPPAELDTNRPTLFVWEGVTNYLDERSVDETIRWCSAAPPPSNLVFTYVDEALFDDPTAFLGARRVLATSQRVGEAVTFGMRPSAMREYLADRGFELVSDIGAAEYRTRYLGAALRGHEFYRVAHARRVHTSDASYEQP
jgi:methyltransferase (TIGR00027 family)